MKLYDIIGEKRLSNFLKKEFGLDLSRQEIVEIKNENLYGDFIVVDGYKFKKVYSEYQVMETPTHKHSKAIANIIKCKTDSLNYK